MREREDFSLSEFSREAGVERSTLANYEHGVTPLPFDAALRICDRLNLSLRWLATGAAPDRPFASLDAIRLPGLCVPPSSTLSEVYPAQLAGACDAWFAAHPAELLIERQLQEGTGGVVRRASDRQLFRFVREWLADFRKRPASLVTLAILGNAEAAMQEIRTRTEKKLGRKIPVDALPHIEVMTAMQIADRIKKVRAKLGLTQTQAAEKWGVPMKTLQRWEYGKHKPRGLGLVQLETILRAAEKPNG